jgi:hypothetical protein
MKFMKFMKELMFYKQQTRLNEIFLRLAQTLLKMMEKMFYIKRSKLKIEQSEAK